MRAPPHLSPRSAYVIASIVGPFGSIRQVSAPLTLVEAEATAASLSGAQAASTYLYLSRIEIVRVVGVTP